MSSDTEVFKAEKNSGILIYRLFIAISLLAVTGLGAWNLSETHSAAILIRGLTQRVADRDEEINRMAIVIDRIEDRQSKQDTRISIIETRLTKP